MHQVLGIISQTLFWYIGTVISVALFLCFNITIPKVYVSKINTLESLELVTVSLFWL